MKTFYSSSNDDDDDSGLRKLSFLSLSLCVYACLYLLLSLDEFEMYACVCGSNSNRVLRVFCLLGDDPG